MINHLYWFKGCWTNVILFAFGGWFYYLSFFYCDKEYERAQVRIEEKLENIARTCRKHIVLRLSMLCALVMTFGFCAWISSAFLVCGSALLLFIPFIITPLVLWLCLVLDACDPLKRKQNPA